MANAFFIKANELDVTIYLLVEINGLDRCNFVISRLYACLNLLSRLNRKERAFGVMVLWLILLECKCEHLNRVLLGGKKAH